MSDNVLEFPDRAQPSDTIANDLDRMGEIALNLIINCSAREDGFHDLELASFAVGHLAKMAKEFRANYQKRWFGQLRGVS